MTEPIHDLANLRWMAAQLILVLGLFEGVEALENGLGHTPAMGYNTWNDFQCEGVSARNISKVADKMVALGLPKLGYKYLIIDDCWAVGRTTAGVLIPDPEAFPDGMKSVADYVHAKGMNFGIYTDRGYWTCEGRPGSAGFEEIDAKTFASWGVDYVKTDSCNAPDSLEDEPSSEAIVQYELFRDSLKATGRPVYLALSGWHNWYSPYGQSLANSWRIGYDVRNWLSAWNYAIRVNAFLASYAGPGAWNDPDMLVGSSPEAACHMTPQQSWTQFSLWAVMAAPLLIGSNMLHMNAFDVETYTNQDVISVDQDPLGIQGEIVWENCPVRKRENILQGHVYDRIPSCQQVWARPLHDGSFAVVLLNLAPSETQMQFRISDVCWSGSGKYRCPAYFEQANVRDLWTKKHSTVEKVLTMTVPPDGASRMLKVEPVVPPPPLLKSTPSKEALKRPPRHARVHQPLEPVDAVQFLQRFESPRTTTEEEL